MLDGILEAVQVLFVWPNPLWILGGLIFGLVIGIIPGMAGSIALALLIPLTLTMDTEAALLFLVAAYSPVGFGGQLTSILVNTPGAPENAATTFDGYPMTRQGRAGAAIGAATTSSVIGGLIGMSILLALIPGAQLIILQLSFPEFFMMALVGLTVIAVLLDGAVIKGLIAAGSGLILTFVGLDPITGNPRLTFEQQYLWDGIGIIPALLGLFAGAEALSLFGRNRKLASEPQSPDQLHDDSQKSDEPVTFFEGVIATSRHKMLILRTSVIGAVLGMIPGIGGAVSGFIGYSHAKQTSKHPEKFGKGAIDGVIGAETANDAKEGGTLLPTVAFGIPGSVGMAVLLGALLVHGVPTGPTLMSTHMHVVYIIIVAMIVCKLIAPFFVWVLAQQAERITKAPPGIVAPLVVVAAVVGVYSDRVDIRDVIVALVFGYVGYAMKRYGFSRVALVLALVLGELVEQSYNQTVLSFGGTSAFFTRPISMGLFLIAVTMVTYSVVRYLRRRKVQTATTGASEADDDELAVNGRFQWGRYGFSLLLLGLGAASIYGTQEIQPAARVMPTALGAVVVALALLVLASDLYKQLAARSSTNMPPPEGPERTESGRAHKRIPATELGTQVEPKDKGADVGSLNAAQQLARQALATTDATPNDRTVVLRQLLFGGWAVGLIALAWVLGFGIAIPIALLLFLLFAAKERILKSVVVTAVATGFLYILFDTLLGTPLMSF